MSFEFSTTFLEGAAQVTFARPPSPRGNHPGSSEIGKCLFSLLQLFTSVPGGLQVSLMGAGRCFACKVPVVRVSGRWQTKTIVAHVAKICYNERDKNPDNEIRKSE